MHDLNQQARRATTATEILTAVAWLGLGAAAVFWAIFFLALVEPVTIPEYLLSGALACCYAVVLPMLISLLAPGTPAGMLLAETRWKTIGHWVAVAATVYMLGHVAFALWSWWASRPAVAEAGMALPMALGSVVVLILVPALAWVQVAPDRWVAEIVQARQVQRLKAAYEANLAMVVAQYARALAIIKRGLANATVAEREEVAQTLIAIQRAENEAVGKIADSLAIMTGIDTGVRLVDDPVIERQYHDLAAEIRRVSLRINDAPDVATGPHDAPLLPPPSRGRLI